MAHAASEMAAMCVGLIGLIGAAATTGMPMWKVTAFIGENIIVMETRWEGLWMNCYRQANIRMQCKVYDSLLFLPPELQAARGLMCCSLALSGLGLLVALAGLRCVSCFRSDGRAKAVFLLAAGGMQLAASVCVFIPVSWTGHVIIRDFYNPLLIDAQRRELGEALYVGWVTGAFLFASAALFLCRRTPSGKGSFDVYQPAANLLRYEPHLARYHPLSTLSSLGPRPQPSVPHHASLRGLGQPLPRQAAMFNPPLGYELSAPGTAPQLHPASLAHRSSAPSSDHVGSLYAPGNSLYIGQSGVPFSLANTGNQTASFQSSFHPVPHTPVFVTYKESRVQPGSHSNSNSSRGVYI